MMKMSNKLAQRKYAQLNPNIWSGKNIATRS